MLPRLQAQAAGVPCDGFHQMACFASSTMLQDVKYMPSSAFTQPTCSPECTRYKGTLDVFYKVMRQEGFLRLWTGTNASLALAVPTVGIYMPLYDIFCNYMEELTSQNAPTMTPYSPLVAGSLARSVACITCYPVELVRTRMQAFKHNQASVKPPGVWKTLIDAVSNIKNPQACRISFVAYIFMFVSTICFMIVFGREFPVSPYWTSILMVKIETVQSYRILWTGLGAQLARDVPFSAVCWSLLEPFRRRILSGIGNEASLPSVLGVNFGAGFVAGSIAAASTCPLDVARTRRQIEKDPKRVLTMTTRQTLVEIWRDGGIKGLFTGAGPRVARAGPSVGIVVSFYEVVKHALHNRQLTE
ncbi:mitochondrial carrier protein MTM1-like isoform X3 [Primulina tabacum]|uniref:mitochondrial carrier protein MTM1-like isoform X3 n=1 Tax=Primulina tabacum TaxID=48773 RepID=UPI003F59731D